jgi:hypothetical protein
MKDPFGLAWKPYNIEGDYQKRLLKICEIIDERREEEEKQHGTSKLEDLKISIKTLIFNMARSERFYGKPQEKVKAWRDIKKVLDEEAVPQAAKDKIKEILYFKGDNKRNIIYEIRKSLKDITEYEEIENVMDDLDQMIMTAKVFLKSSEDIGGPDYFGEG